MSLEKREISRQSKTPILTKEVVGLLTKLCFRPDDILTPAELLFVFGNSQTERMAELTKIVLNRKLVSKVVLTGGTPKFEDSVIVPKPESQLVLDSINPNLFPDVEFFIESVSDNTLANVTEALKVLDFSSYKKIIFLFKKHDSRRGYLTLKKLLPKTELLQVTFPGVYKDGITITEDSWFKNEVAISRVWGEYLRINKYGRRGDIAFDEVADIVEAIEKLTE
ncbi:MAG: hypothetical protein K8Q91_02010 [Candidatus Vogelbacteria bacterium]|nr:hypothetical protein [Candidatus Vogelbacteria bacterium]